MADYLKKYMLWLETLVMQVNDPLKLNNLINMLLINVKIISYRVFSLNIFEY